MSSSRKRFLLLCVVIFILIMIYVVKNFGGYQKTSHYSLQTVSSISLNKGNAGNIYLYKNKSQWFLKKGYISYPADQKKIQTLLASLATMESDQIVSDNPAKRTDFGIGKNELILHTINKSYRYEIGVLPETDDAFVTINHGASVYQVPSLAMEFQDDYRNLLPLSSLINADVADVTEQYDNESLSLTQNKSDWQINGKQAIRERVDYFLNDLETLRATDMTNSPPSYTNPTLTITISGHKKKTTAISLFSVDENDYALMITGYPFTYIVPSPYVAGLKKTEEDFLE